MFVFLDQIERIKELKVAIQFIRTLYGPWFRINESNENRQNVWDLYSGAFFSRVFINQNRHYQTQWGTWQNIREQSQLWLILRLLHSAVDSNLFGWFGFSCYTTIFLLKSGIWTLFCPYFEFCIDASHLYDHCKPAMVSLVILLMFVFLFAVCFSHLE